MKYDPKVMLLVLAALGVARPGLAADLAAPGAERWSVYVGSAWSRTVLPMEGAFEAVPVMRDTVARGEVGEPYLVEVGLVRSSALGRVRSERAPIARGLVRRAPRLGGVAPLAGLVPAERGGAASSLVLGEPVRRLGESIFATGRLEPAGLEEEVLREANATRRSAGSGVLVVDAALGRAARDYARELAERREIEHISPTPGRRTFRERITAAGAHPRLGGENLARVVSTADALGGRVVRAWMNSPGHRVNLLDPIFSRTGIGVWLGGDGVWYVVQVYGTGS